MSKLLSDSSDDETPSKPSNVSVSTEGNASTKKKVSVMQLFVWVLCIGCLLALVQGSRASNAQVKAHADENDDEENGESNHEQAADENNDESREEPSEPIKVVKRGRAAAKAAPSSKPRYFFLSILVSSSFFF